MDALASTDRNNHYDIFSGWI